MKEGQRCTIKIGQKEVELPIKTASLGDNCIDIAELKALTGLFTFDPGYLSTASCESKITYIDGDKGILLHRGYRIEDVAGKLTFAEAFFLILYGELPSKNQSDEFDKKLVSLMKIPENVKAIIKTFDVSLKPHPMGVIMSCLSYMSAFGVEEYDIKNNQNVIDNVLKITAQVVFLSSMVYRYLTGREFIDSDPSKNFMQNFITAMFSKDDKLPSHAKVLEDAFNKLLILHIDHEQNASTSTVRLVGSTEANLYAVVASGFAALWGPLHGGANEAVINMLEDIGDVSKVEEFINTVKNKQGGARLMGFGHRVYKSYDPRASVLKSSCDKMLSSMGVKNEKLKIATYLEQTALKDEYFVQKKLFPNVDFYSGIIYESIGIQKNFFTVIFGLARTAGWLTQLNEMTTDKKRKINRPRQLYTGSLERKIP